jgi:ubiquinone/menaquinone biosynthesis C-methylase UbiE
MNNLYTTHSEIYEMMYQTFINYDEEYAYYSDKLKKYNAESVVELGCGTGSLASRFTANGFDYTGLDLNKTMLDIAERKSPGAKFIEADMRSFQLPGKKQACLIAGRTISYLITNQDVLDSFNTIHRHLQTDGIVCFDNIDAAKFIPLIKNGKRVIHKAEFEGRKFHRESYWSVNGNQSWTFNWDSVYFEEDKKGGLKKIAEDNSTVRCFTKDDLCLFLELCNFSVKEIEDRPSYAFDTFVIVAQKNS